MESHIVVCQGLMQGFVQRSLPVRSWADIRHVLGHINRNFSVSFENLRDGRMHVVGRWFCIQPPEQLFDILLMRGIRN